MILKFKAPKSFTGENLIEIHCHGSMLIVSEILTLLSKKKIREANPGEFTQQALLNNKLDLVQAEAINSLINAKNRISKSKALEDLNGEKKKIIYKIEKEVTKLIIHLQTNIDYPENLDIKKLSDIEIIPIIKKLLKDLKAILDGSLRIKPIFSGINIAIIGKPNVGKSSLMNYISNKEKSIVTNIPGTTRDLIEEKVIINNFEFNFIDTAGIRKAINEIENLGVLKTKKAFEKSDIVIAMFDASNKMDVNDKKILDLIKSKKNVLIVLNKIDRRKIIDLKGIEISIKTNKTKLLLNELDKITKNFIQKQDLNNDSFFINERQIEVIKKIYVTLKKIDRELQTNVPLDIILLLLEETKNYILSLSGTILEKKDLEKIFSNFCLGK